MTRGCGSTARVLGGIAVVVALLGAAVGCTLHGDDDGGAGDAGPPVRCGDGLRAPGELCWTAVTSLPIPNPQLNLQPHLVDLEPDGDLDLVYARGVVVARLNAGGSFGAEVTLAGGSAYDRILPADTDGDGDTDLLAVVQGSDIIDLWLNDGTGMFAKDAMRFPSGIATDPFSGVAALVSLAAGDLERDGDLDLVALDTSNTVRSYLDLGGASFATPALHRIGRGGANGGLLLADTDRDGFLDVITPTVTLVNDRLGRFATPPLAQESLESPDLALFDADGDGQDDVVFSTFKWRFRQQGAIGGPGKNMPGSLRVGAMLSADLDGDGRTDLLSQALDEDPIGDLVLVRGGTRHCQRLPLPLSPGFFVRFAFGDVSGDGHPELVVASASQFDIVRAVP